MKSTKKRLAVEQLDQKLGAFKEAQHVVRPDKGWLFSIRTTLNMTLSQLAKRMNTTPQNIKAAESRESNGNITLNALNEAAAAMEMKVVYAVVPKETSLNTLIHQKAALLATQIVSRTSASMKLEDQENTKLRLAKAIQDKTEEIEEELPRYLWESN
ncbi:mobile mystery protein A [Mucilaginibacter ginkgonis]|uniref:Mobile mystery protein A n=1 Tax=Mucilaginibacter ginkgonis TaxID=2682091 RepID=A0A7T7FAW6_9SPHI|nr:mobile mystery protein A [Mucilaginibacter ginkgonis]QQL49957.1 mobile mystery protein A [Mucilaginibacter ginkgonis]